VRVSKKAEPNLSSAKKALPSTTLGEKKGKGAKPVYYQFLKPFLFSYIVSGLREKEESRMSPTREDRLSRLERVEMGIKGGGKESEPHFSRWWGRSFIYHPSKSTKRRNGRSASS